jgi:hypothetical protein
MRKSLGRRGGRQGRGGMVESFKRVHLTSSQARRQQQADAQVATSAPAEAQS